jgi:hypothetical protein
MLYFAEVAAEYLDEKGELSPAAKTRWQHAKLAIDRRIAQTLPHPLSDPTLREGPDLAVIGIRACAVCGCTDESACEGGCHWVGPDLCSRCDPEAKAAEGHA